MRTNRNTYEYKYSANDILGRKMLTARMNSLKGENMNYIYIISQGKKNKKDIKKIDSLIPPRKIGNSSRA